MKQLIIKFNLILKKLIINYVVKNTWFEKSVIKLSSYEHQDIMCNISDKYLADFKELEQVTILKIKKTYWKNFKIWNKNKSELILKMFMNNFFKQN